MKAVPTFERTAQSLERTGETVVTTVVSVRRRLDIVMLRWQARLDAPVWDRSCLLYTSPSPRDRG